MSYSADLPCINRHLSLSRGKFARYTRASLASRACLYAKNADAEAFEEEVVPIYSQITPRGHLAVADTPLILICSCYTP